MTLLDLISNELRLDPLYIQNIAKHNRAYKKYTIPKNNGTRTIFQPSKELKLLQYWLVRRFFSEFPISKFSSAYSKGNSIKMNAYKHRNSNYILHLDITNFFESITSSHIDQLINKTCELPESDINLIKSIILYDNKYLVIGSVASPMVSNCIMYDIDMNIYENLIKNNDLIYTRYADDIYISSKHRIDKKIIEDVSNILNNYQFKLNNSKGYFMNRYCKRKITGITIDNNDNSLSLGCKNMKHLKNRIYNFLIKQQGEKDELLGYLSFLRDINIKKYNNIKRIYSRYDKDKILFQ